MRSYRARRGGIGICPSYGRYVQRAVMCWFHNRGNDLNWTTDEEQR
jgi:hypothetical protein